MIVDDHIQGETIIIKDKIVDDGKPVDLTGADMSASLGSTMYHGNNISLTASSQNPTSGEIEATISESKSQTISGVYRYIFKATTDGKTHKKLGYINIKSDCQ